MSDSFKAVDKLIAYIQNNPTADIEQIEQKAKALGKEVGISGQSLISQAHGSSLIDKSSSNLNRPFIDLADELVQSDITPSRKYILDPNNPKSVAGEMLAKEWKKYEPKSSIEGEAFVDRLKNVAWDTKEGDITNLLIPKGIVIRDAKTDAEKLKRLSAILHENKHIQEYIADPKFINDFLDLPEEEQPQAGKLGHHKTKKNFEVEQLVKEVRDLPDTSDQEYVKRVLSETERIKNQLKQLNKTEQMSPEEYISNVKKLGYFPKFGKLMAALGPAGALMSAGSEASEGKYGRAALKAASAIDPTGITDAAADILRRSEMSPEERAEQLKEDKYVAMPTGLDSPADIMLDQLEDELNIQKEREKQKTKLGYK